MKVLRKATIFALACWMFLTACSSAGVNSGSGEENVDTSSQSSITEEGAAVEESDETSEPIDADAGLHNLEDGVLDIGTTVSWESLTPFRGLVGGDAPYLGLVYESLAKLTSDAEYIPWVAKEWSAEEDGLTFNVEIYDYVTDSAGNKITAADIVWMIEASKEAGLKTVFAKVENVEQTGDYTFKIKLTQDFTGALESILIHTYVISKSAYESSKDQFATEVVSTSPYVLTQFVANSVFSFEKRDNYWQSQELINPANAANVSKISFHVITEASQAGIALETKTIDAFVNLDSNTVEQFMNHPDYEVASRPHTNGTQVFFSGAPNSVVAEDLALRQAIAYAIDSEALVSGVYAGFGKVMHDPIADTSVGYLEKWKSEEYYPYDVDKAKELLAESNYNNEELVLLSLSNSTMQRNSQMIQAYLLQIGINVKLNLVDQALFTSTRLDGTQYDLVLNTVGGDNLADHWAVRYDMNAYRTGDATSRHDEVLAEMLYRTWSVDGYTPENIDEVHTYIKDNMYAYGLVQAEIVTIWRKDIGLTDQVSTFRAGIDFVASLYNE